MTSQISYPHRYTLAAPIKWRGETVAALTALPLTDALERQVRRAARIRSGRRAIVRVVATVAGCPTALVTLLSWPDLVGAARWAARIFKEAGL